MIWFIFIMVYYSTVRVDLIYLCSCLFFVCYKYFMYMYIDTNVQYACWMYLGADLVYHK